MEPQTQLLEIMNDTLINIGDKIRAQEPFFRKKYRNRIKNWAVRDIEEDKVHGTLIGCVEWYRRKVKFTRYCWFKLDEIENGKTEA